ncbi:hypothetical protein N008_07075 [Hymenobacter sp. APR13]|nr:hypothetical protein N008_07075 [Hymenobacter sp. APR13]
MVDVLMLDEWMGQQTVMQSAAKHLASVVILPH